MLLPFYGLGLQGRSKAWPGGRYVWVHTCVTMCPLYCIYIPIMTCITGTQTMEAIPTSASTGTEDQVCQACTACARDMGKQALASHSQSDSLS